MFVSLIEMRFFLVLLLEVCNPQVFAQILLERESRDNQLIQAGKSVVSAASNSSVSLSTPIQTPTPTPTGKWRPSANIDTNSSLNIVIGVIGAGLLIILLIFTKILQWCRAVMDLLEKNRNESDDADRVERCGENDHSTVEIEYELQNKSHNLRTISGILAAMLRGKLDSHQTPELRTASSYRESLRKFRINQKQSEEVLPTYYDVTKSVEHQDDVSLPEYGEVVEAQISVLKDQQDLQ